MALQIKNPIRMYRESDPYYYEVDNLPLEDLLENCGRLQLQINDLPDFSVFATVGALESKYVKLVDYNARRLSDLEEDINISTTPKDDDILMFAGTYHAPNSPDLGGRWSPVTMTDRTDLFPQNLKDLHDVDPLLAPGDGQVLKYIAGEWTAADDIEFSELNDLTDVVIANAATEDIIHYKSGKWQNGWPDNLPKFKNVGTEVTGDILSYDGGKYTPVAPADVFPYQTHMFKNGGVAVYHGSLSAELLGADHISWSDNFKSCGTDYSHGSYTINDGVLYDGSDYDISDEKPTHAYVMGTSQVTKDNSYVNANNLDDYLGAIFECAIFDKPNGQSSRSTGLHHSNHSNKRASTTAGFRPKVVRSFSGWVPIYYDTAGTPKLCIETWASTSIHYKPKDPRMHIRVLGVRT